VCYCIVPVVDGEIDHDEIVDDVLALAVAPLSRRSGYRFETPHIRRYRCYTVANQCQMLAVIVDVYITQSTVVDPSSLFGAESRK